MKVANNLLWPLSGPPKPTIAGRASLLAIREPKATAGVAELADALDLGSRAQIISSRPISHIAPPDGQ